MATYADLFGKKSGGSKTPFFKYEETGDEYLLVQTDEHQTVPQTMEHNGRRVNKWIVQVNEGDKYKPMAEGTFDEGEVANAFQPDHEIRIPVKVMARKLKSGEKAADFEPYDALWDLAGGDLTEKLQDAMLESEVPAIEGTKYVTKRLSTNPKPYKYSIRMKAGE